MDKQAVTLLGLGPMGQAMGAAFLDRGHALTVWNRSPGKADGLVARGAVLADGVDAALRANDLVVLSLTDYDAMYGVLGPAQDALAGRVVVNLSSDTPDRAREAAAWIAERGGTHLTGGVRVPPSGIGQPGTSTFYSGPREVFERHKETLETLTGADHLGEDPGRAALFYQLQMTVFWTTMLSWLQAVALAGAHGVTAEELVPYVKDTVDIGQFLDFYSARVDRGEHPGDVDRLTMGVASIEHVVHTARDSGVDSALPSAVHDIFRRGVAAGRGADSFTSLLEVLRKPAA
ncbi:NAD(P)-binding domain-containing protein [Streptomyces sp. SID4919]|uniref:NAD(P)-dependent oxidoreductase n=1 Tax=unclassified Streptomyces TaxID=2593676 RepID=UPI000823AB41|nr:MULTISPECIES: NAD(P)-binding domain-containing protein [unclassified Streptomyces]MYY11397.1 NAD(P)-binding domain-containing protein [Streptomyces sp. SID4919]SCK57603.1 3-hydroxyisobutyrate dehydrogenase [Streptomyces sp. AmelKG-E11A]